MTKEQLSKPQLAAWRAFHKAHTLVTGRFDHGLVEAHRLPLSWYDGLIEPYEAPVTSNDEVTLRIHVNLNQNT